jgi:DNA helicase II / ATP-dependent DNA helicase PcrA
LNDAIVNGKLDAVFYGGLDPSDASKRFTVVDWKTGRKPVKAQEVNEKLLQLDLYRLLFSQITGYPLESIDATLYYLDRAQEADREIHAQVKGREEIIAEFNNGIPVLSDND